METSGVIRHGRVRPQRARKPENDAIAVAIHNLTREPYSLIASQVPNKAYMYRTQALARKIEASALAVLANLGNSNSQIVASLAHDMTGEDFDDIISGKAIISTRSQMKEAAETRLALVKALFTKIAIKNDLIEERREKEMGKYITNPDTDQAPYLVDQEIIAEQIDSEEDGRRPLRPGPKVPGKSGGESVKRKPHDIGWPGPEYITGAFKQNPVMGEKKASKTDKGPNTII